MTKLQKVLLWLGLGMFVIPEVVWSPVLNIIYNLFNLDNHSVPLRQNFLFKADNLAYLMFVIMFQLFGIIIGMFFSLKLKTSFIKYITILLFTVLLLASVFVLFLVLSLRNGISF